GLCSSLIAISFNGNVGSDIIIRQQIAGIHFNGEAAVSFYRAFVLYAIDSQRDEITFARVFTDAAGNCNGFAFRLSVINNVISGDWVEGDTDIQLHCNSLHRYVAINVVTISVGYAEGKVKLT